MFKRDPTLYYLPTALIILARQYLADSSSETSNKDAMFDQVGVIVLQKGVPYVLEQSSSSSQHGTTAKLRRYDARIKCSKSREIIVRPLGTVPTVVPNQVSYEHDVKEKKQKKQREIEADNNVLELTPEQLQASREFIVRATTTSFSSSSSSSSSQASADNSFSSTTSATSVVRELLSLVVNRQTNASVNLVQQYYAAIGILQPTTLHAKPNTSENPRITSPSPPSLMMMMSMRDLQPPSQPWLNDSIKTNQNKETKITQQTTSATPPFAPSDANEYAPLMYKKTIWVRDLR